MSGNSPFPNAPKYSKKKQKSSKKKAYNEKQENTIMQQLAIDTIKQIRFHSRDWVKSNESIEVIKSVSLKILENILNGKSTNGGYVYWFLKSYIKQAETQVGYCFANKRKEFNALILSTYTNKLQYYQ